MPTIVINPRFGNLSVIIKDSISDAIREEAMYSANISKYFIYHKSLDINLIHCSSNITF